MSNNAKREITVLLKKLKIEVIDYHADRGSERESKNLLLP